MYLATALTGVTPLLGSSYLVHGAAGVGGSRSWVYASNSGQGLWETVGQSVQPMSTSKLYAPEGTTVVPTGREVTTRGLGGDQYEIQRIDSTDRSGLASLGVAPTQPPAAAATPAGTQFTGTVLALSTTEVMNGEPAPNVYYVLQLDAPTQSPRCNLAGVRLLERRISSFSENTASTMMTPHSGDHSWASG